MSEILLSYPVTIADLDSIWARENAERIDHQRPEHWPVYVSIIEVLGVTQ